MKQTQKFKGFSLVELIVIIAIITALVAVVSMSTGLITRAHAKSAAQDIVSMLNRCRAESLSGLDCYVQLNNSYVALCKTDGNVELERENFKKTVTIKDGDKHGLAEKYSNTRIAFDMSTGGRTKGKGTYYITLGSVKYTISINDITGAVSVS